LANKSLDDFLDDWDKDDSDKDHSDKGNSDVETELKSPPSQNGKKKEKFKKKSVGEKNRQIAEI